MKFNYQARTKTGGIQSGIVEASSRETALEVLKTRNLYVTALEAFSPPVYAQRLKIFERITKKDIVIFSRQLAIMFRSKVPLVEIFQTLAKQTKNTNFKEKITRIQEEVEGGMTLSSALSLFPALFSTFYISMVKSGEATGKLTEVFLYLADYLERENYFRSKLTGAMVYPAFVLGVFIIVFIVIITYVIPAITDVLKESGQELPLLTRIAMAVADFFRNQWWLFLTLIGLIAAGASVGLKTPAGKRFFHENVVKVPLLGGFLKKFYLSRFALNLSTLISGGLPIAQALDITGEIVGNLVYRDIILKVRDGVKRGDPMSSILQNYPRLVSPLFLQMVVVGEKTGTLDSTLNNIVDFYQKDIDRSLDDFIKLLEPLFLVLLGLIVGGLVGAVLMPIYTTMGNIK